MDGFFPSRRSRGSLFDVSEGNPTADSLSIASAALMDAGNAFSGRADQVGQLQELASRQQQQRMRQEVLGALNSGDPALVKKAEMFIAMNGGNVEAVREAMGRGKPRYQQFNNNLYAEGPDGKLSIAVAGPAPAPETRTYEDGNFKYTQERDPNAPGGWRQIGKAPRWQPQRPTASSIGVPGLGSGWKITGGK